MSPSHPLLLLLSCLLLALLTPCAHGFKYQGQAPSPGCDAMALFKPQTYAELGLVVQQGQLLGQGVRAIGALHANSDLSCTPGFVISMERLNRLVSVDAERQVAVAQAGIKLGALLRELAQDGFSLAHFPSYGGLTLGGALATGSFGSSLTEQAALHDQVLSVTLADGTGQVLTLAKPDLPASLASLGLLGVIVEVSLRIVPLYKARLSVVPLHEHSLFSGEATRILEQFPGAELLWYPENNMTLARYFERVSPLEKGSCSSRELDRAPEAWALLGQHVEAIQGAADHQAMCETSEKLQDEIASLVDFEDEGRPCSSPMVGFPHELLVSSCEEGRCPWDSGLHLLRSSVAIPLAHLYQALAEVRLVVEKHRACFPFGGINIRFLKASQALLSLSYGQDMAVFELATPRRSVLGAPRLGLAALQEIEQLLLQSFGGRPHWGKASMALLVEPEHHYPESWPIFTSTMARLDPEGTYKNEFYRRLVGEAAPSKEAGCALEGQCVCSESSHCARGQKCSSGPVFPGASICLSPPAAPSPSPHKPKGKGR